MKYFKMYLLIGVLLFIGCQDRSNSDSNSFHPQTSKNNRENKSDFVVVFASCNDQNREQPLWDPIIQNKPDVFIWGGDNVYADTSNLEKMQNDYQKVLDNPDYKLLSGQTTILGTWDDHDYGKNDAGAEWEQKEGAKKILLDFLDVPEDAAVRNREGVYQSKNIQSDKGSIKFILLDTRYFRTGLKKATDGSNRYIPWQEEDGGTILGEAQWKWLNEELKDDTADFTVIVSSIQYLSDQHGWEKWANHPGEVKKMYQTLQNAKAKNILFLSGDRHMAEISVNDDSGLGYPLVDFTASGLTHTWITSSTEENPYRISNVIKRLNFGVLHFDFNNKKVRFQIKGENDFTYEEFTAQY